jgi:16S rRNA processing protein RimM
MAQAVWPGLGVYLQQGDSLDSHEIAAVGTPGKHIVVSFVGIADRNSADPLTGAKVLVRRADLPALENDEYYDFELLGATVESRTGQQLGTVVEILPTGANQVYVVRGEDGQEILVPAFFGAVIEVNRAEKRIVVDPTALEYSKRDD